MGSRTAAPARRSRHHPATSRRARRRRRQCGCQHPRDQETRLMCVPADGCDWVWRLAIGQWHWLVPRWGCRRHHHRPCRQHFQHHQTPRPPSPRQHPAQAQPGTRPIRRRHPRCRTTPRWLPQPAPPSQPHVQLDWPRPQPRHAPSSRLANAAGGCGDCGGCCCDSTPSSSPRRASGACLG